MMIRFFHGWLYNHPDAEKRIIFIQVKHEANNSASNTRIYREYCLRLHACPDLTASREAQGSIGGVVDVGQTRGRT
jgi:hypothetical protein